MLDDALLQRIARSQVGDGVRLWRQDRGTDSPMNTALDLVDEVLPRPYAVFWVDGGPPEMLALPDLNPAVVMFSVRHLEMMAQLRGVLTARAFDGEHLAAVGEQLTLRMLAELLLRYGDPGLACHFLAESLSDALTHPAPVTLRDLEASPVDESYTTVWFHALLHELGHVAAREHAGAKPTDDPYFGPLYEATLAAYRDTPLWQEDLATPGALDEAVLRAELDADLFSLRLLFPVTSQVILRHGTRDRIEVGDLASEVLLAFHAMQFISNCGAAARGYRTMLSGRLGSVATGVRMNVIIDFLARYIASSGDVANVDPAELTRVRQLVFAAHEIVNQRVAMFDGGHVRALRRRLIPAERRRDAVDRLAQALEQEIGGDFARSEVRRFLALGESLQVRHRDLDLLAELATTGAKPTGLLSERQRVYQIAGLTGNGVTVPFGLTRRDGAYVVFVFATDSPILDTFIHNLQPNLRPGFELVKAAVISPTDQHAVIMIAASLPEHEQVRLEVVFEGSAEFAEQFRQIDDGTFWPDAAGR